MCLIAFKRNENEDYKQDYFELAADNNKHGTGIMYPKDGRIVHKKVGVVDAQINKTLYEEFAAQPVAAIHVRIKTQGEINDFNAHPFCVLDKDVDGVDLYMMHNGVIANAEIIDDTKSDTWHFVNLYLKPLLKGNPYRLTDPCFQKIIEKFIGSSRLVFMYGDGTYVIISDTQGHTSSSEIGGCWLSNRSNSYKRAASSSYYSTNRNTDYLDDGYYFGKFDRPAVQQLPKPDPKPTVAPQVKQEEAKVFQFSKAKEDEPVKECEIPVTDSNQYNYQPEDDEWEYDERLGGFYPSEKGDDKNIVAVFDQRDLFAHATSTDEILDSLVKQSQRQINMMLADEEMMEELVFTLRDLHEEALLQNKA